MPFSCWASLIFGEYSWRGVFGKGAGLTNTQPGPGRSPPPSATSASAPCSPTSCCAGSSSRSAASSDPPPPAPRPHAPSSCGLPAGRRGPGPDESQDGVVEAAHSSLWCGSHSTEKSPPFPDPTEGVSLGGAWGQRRGGSCEETDPPQPLSSWWMRVSSHHPFLFFRVNTVNRS